MKIKSLDELRAIDERSQRSTPWGFAMDGMMNEADAVRVHQDQVAWPELVGDVPSATVAAMNRVRLTFAYGVLDYDLFTVAETLSRFVLELALRERFVAFADGHLTFVDVDGTVVVDPVITYGDVVALVGHQPKRGKGWKVEQAGIEPKFNGSLSALRQWARSNGLLRGQANRVKESALLGLRHEAAHPTGSWTGGPSGIAESIRHTGELINQLWGSPTPGGKHYPAPVLQRPTIIACTDGGRSTMSVESFLADQSDVQGATCVVFGLCDQDTPEFCHTWFDQTVLPSRYLFGPATVEETVEWLVRNRPAECHVDTLDRLFIDVVGSDEWPLRLETLTPTERDLGDATFRVILADSPWDARALARETDHPDDAATPEPNRPPRADPKERAQLIATGTWGSVRQLVADDAPHAGIPSFHVGMNS
ncbi:hypothetical protein KSP35_19855 [Aquihabitans sp. G128]|uniref:hypothetical protein n=1 Tax=Aquihabitans sp. G128 TaxID=2849779 RepID=UPI001C21DB34|nr:hypothetical protein [Aquihabitans sp. G128]QXC60551.1 hypothetical protein KSP35_19855 [Aquihabitans sp. G128]